GFRMEESQNKDELVSDFNEAKNQIMRLGNLWNQFSSSMISGNFMGDKGANWILDNVFGELSTDAEKQDKEKDDKDEKYETKIKKINGLIAKHKDNDKKIYSIMRFKEKILRRLQDDAGKGARYSYADDDMM
ncbi:unnamed protein product, partial [marine sediment metagenome]